MSFCPYLFCNNIFFLDLAAFLIWFSLVVLSFVLVMLLFARWSEEKAVEYLLENTTLTEARARSEIGRYSIFPAQVFTHTHTHWRCFLV